MDPIAAFEMLALSIIKGFFINTFFPVKDISNFFSEYVFIFTVYIFL